MAATEIVTIVTGKFNGRDVHAPTGWKGKTFTKIQDWIVDKERVGYTVIDVTSSVIIKGLSEWCAYAEKIGQDTLVTIFEVENDDDA